MPELHEEQPILQNKGICREIVAALCPTENEEVKLVINLAASLLSCIAAILHYQLILTPASGIEIHERLRVTARTLIIMVQLSDYEQVFEVKKLSVHQIITSKPR